MLRVLRWSGTVAIMLATMMRALGWHWCDLILSLLGSMCWCWAGIKYHDRALISLNAFSMLILLLGIYHAL